MNFWNFLQQNWTELLTHPRRTSLPGFHLDSHCCRDRDSYRHSFVAKKILAQSGFGDR